MSKIIRSLAVAAAGLALLAPTAASVPAEGATPSNTKVATYNTAKPMEDDQNRMRKSLAFMQQNGIVIAATQEFGPGQTAVVANSPDWRQFRATHNLGNSGNAVIWRAGRWKKIQAWQYTLMLHENGKTRPLHFPVVRLQNTRNNRVINVVSIHQPAGPGNKAERTRLRGEHRKKIAALKAKYDHVLVMGDFNESKPVACGWTRQNFLLDASHYNDRGAQVCGDMKPKQQSIDRIFGQNKIKFSNYDKLTKPDDQKWSNHNMIVAQVSYW